MADNVTSGKRRVVFVIVALLAAGVMGIAVLRALGFFPVSRRSETRGEFKITHVTYDSFGHRFTQTAIHERRALRDRLVASDVVGLVIKEQEPGRVFYQTCAASRDACGTYYYDVSLGRSAKVAGYRISISSLHDPDAWSPAGSSGAYATLAGEEDAVIVNLVTGAAMDVRRRLGLTEPSATVRFGPWRPDGRGVVALVTNTVRQDSAAAVHTEQDLFVIYPGAQGAVEYIASASPGWSREDYTWRQTGSLWTLPPSLKVWGSSRTAGTGIWRKTPGELPYVKANPDHLTW